MEQVTDILFYLGLVLYSVAATLYFVELARRDGLGPAARWAPHILALGALVHASHVVTASLLTNVCPVGSLPFSLSLSGWLSVVVYLFVRQRLRIHAMGVVVAPAALAFLVVAQFVGGGQSTGGTLLTLHILANLLGVGLFLLAGFAGAFYLVQERRLKAKRSMALNQRMPALDALDNTEYRLLLAGFPFLTFGVITGGLFLHALVPGAGVALVRALLAYVTWIVMASVLVLRAVGGWRGRRAAYGTVAGVACVLLVMVIYVVQAGGQS